MQEEFHDSKIWESKEGDFNYIEEATDPNRSANSEVDGKYILARVEGPAFFPETVSEGNSVYYPQEAWENAISDLDFKRRLADRLVYGTIGHNIELTDDEIREGLFSHVVTRVWINEENIGRAEYLIYNTGPGQRLNMLLRTKSKLRVSTKAAGRFDRDTSGGIKKVLPNTFKLERIDFVVDPGYSGALPAVLEHKTNESLINIDEEGKSMENEKVVKILESRIDELKGAVTISESTINSLRDELFKIKESAIATNLLLDSYKQLGTPAAIQESLSTLTQYESLGTVHEIHEAFDQGEDQLDQMSNTIQSLQDQVNETPDEYKELGEPEEIKMALSQALDAVDTLEKYQALGTPEELEQVVANAEQMAEAMEDQEKETLAAKHGVSTEVIDNMCAKGLTIADCDEILSAAKGTTAPVAPESTEETPKVAEGEGCTDKTVTEDDETDLNDDENDGSERETIVGGEGESDDEQENEEDKMAALTESRSSQALRKLRRGKAKISESKSSKTKVSLVQRLITTRR